MGTESPPWVVEHSVAAGVWTAEARTRTACMVWAGRGPASWGLDGTSAQTLEPEGLEHGEGQADSARFSESSLDQARPGEHARQALLHLKTGLGDRAQRRTRYQAFPSGMAFHSCFLWENKVPGVQCVQPGVERHLLDGAVGTDSDTAPPRTPWTQATNYDGFWDFPHLPRTLKTWRPHLTRRGQLVRSAIQALWGGTLLEDIQWLT